MLQRDYIMRLLQQFFEALEDVSKRQVLALAGDSTITRFFFIILCIPFYFGAKVEKKQKHTYITVSYTHLDVYKRQV